MYPVWLVIFAIIPSILISIWKPNLLRDYKKVIFFALVGSIIFSFPWDFIAISQKIWFFPAESIMGLKIARLPIEEWLFILSYTYLFAMITLVFWNKKKK